MEIIAVEVAECVLIHIILFQLSIFFRDRVFTCICVFTSKLFCQHNQDFSVILNHAAGLLFQKQGFEYPGRASFLHL